MPITNQASAIQKTLLTTTGDIIAASAANTPARIAAAASGQVLTAQGAGVLPAWAAAGGGADYPMKLKPAIVRWVLPGWYARIIINSATTEGRLLYIPIFVTESTTYISIGIYVGTAGAAGSEARLGIYNWSSGLPGTLVLDAGKVSVDTTGAKEITISQALARGYYFAAFVTEGAPNVYGFDAALAVTPPVPGLGGGLSVALMEPILAVTARVADVDGGLVSPAPAPTSTNSVGHALILMREN